jgi:hypothetical protein
MQIGVDGRRDVDFGVDHIEHWLKRMVHERHSAMRPAGRLLRALIAACVVSGCAMTATPLAPDSQVQAGQWGGQHIAMNVAAASTEIEFDCGRATVPGPIETNRDGGFAVTGTFLQDRPGPTTPNGPAQRPIRLSGTVKGNDMQVSIVLTDSNEDLGSFTLTFGATARLVKCK